MKASRPYCRSVLSTLLAGSVLASQTAAVYAQTAPVLQPPVPGSPAWDAALRLGLPGNFVWRSEKEKARLVAAAGLDAAPALAA